jgi:hypothetical protein
MSCLLVGVVLPPRGDWVNWLPGNLPCQLISTGCLVGTIQCTFLDTVYMSLLKHDG